MLDETFKNLPQDTAEIIHIPPEARDWSVESLPVQMLTSRLADAKVLRLGDLHERRYKDMLRYKGWGRVFVQHLRRLVRLLHEGGISPRPDWEISAAAREGAALLENISIHPAGWGIELAELNLSARLRGALEQKGITRSDQLNGVPWRRLRAMNNIGPKFLRELEKLIQRLNAGDFQRPSAAFSPTSVSDLIRRLNRALSELPPRYCEALLLRHGWPNERVQSGKSLAAEMGLTAQRIYQMQAATIQQLLRLGGPPLTAGLGGLAGLCRDSAEPLTPERLAGWAGEHNGLLRLPPAVYCRLLAQLHPDLPIRVPHLAR